MKKLFALLTLFMCCIFSYATPPTNKLHSKTEMDCVVCHATTDPAQMKQVETAKCQECHKPFTGSWQKADGSPNPHISIHYAPETLDCKLCHSQHSESKNFCQACHADGLGFKVP